MIEETSAVVADTEVKEAAQEAVVSSEPSRDYEAEAREIGWQPEAEFKGDKSRWKPAEQFVKDGENFIPILKANERKLRLELAKERSDFDTRLAKLDRVNKANFERETAAYKAEIAALKAQQVQAVEAGDVDTFKALDKRLDSIVAPEAPEVEAASEDPAKIEEDYASKSDWYGKDPDLTAYAIGVSRKLAADSPGLPMATNIKMTEEKVKAMFPDKFKKPAANGHAAVDGGGSFSAPSRSDPLSRLPNEARAQAKIDMAAYPKVYPNAQSWIDKYEGKR